MITLLLAAIFLAADTVPTSPAQASLRVATFNIRLGTANDGEDRWEKRRELVFRTMKKMDADVIGMQEVLAFQFDELQKAMPEYESVTAGRDDGKRGGEMGPVFFKSKKFEKLADGMFWLSEEPEKPGVKGWDAALPRIAVWVRLRDRETKQPFLFVCTHFDHKGPQARAESAKLLRARLEQLKADGPAIVVGDFNATEDQKPYSNLLGSPVDPWHLTDSFRTNHPTPDKKNEGTFHGFTGDRDRARIDWILVTPDIKTISSEIVYESEAGHYPSDHFPVVAELQFSVSK